MPKGGFGYALAKEKVDFDGNHFQDMAVGAPFDDTATLLKSRRVLQFKPDFDVKHIDPVDPTSTGNRNYHSYMS